jgi:thiamine pyrophosphokinase
LDKVRALVVANGVLGPGAAAAARALRQSGDRVIAADGGAVHCRALGLRPDVVIGDLDSLDPAEIEVLRAEGVEIVRHPVRKDQTDLELALRWAVAAGADEIVVLAALGGRWDQTLANLLLPALPGLDAVRLRLVDGNQQIYLIQNDTRIEGQAGDMVSLIPIGGDARGVTTTGLEYPLDGGTLSFGSTLGISNVLLSATARVTVEAGMVLCVVIGSSER